jgi:hypothetical protein
LSDPHDTDSSMIRVDEPRAELQRTDPLPPRRDWESTPRRQRFLAFLFLWMGGTIIYMALIFLAMSAVPPEARDWVGIGMFVLYLVVCAVLVLFVAMTEPRSNS